MQPPAKLLPIGCLLVLCALITGCGPLRTRSVIPEHHIAGAVVEGYGDIRYWGDEPSEPMNQSLIVSWQQERAHLGLAEDAKEFPPSNVLAISGGGQNGAYGAGVLCGWTDAGNRPTFKIVTGISTGALTAPFAFLGSAYDQSLREVYTSVNEQDIAIFQGFLMLFRGDSAYDTAPLARLAEKYFNDDMLDKIATEHRNGRRLFIGTTHLDAQRPMVWDVGAIACSDRPDRVQLFRKVLLASAAIPGAFPPVYLKVRAPDGSEHDEMHVDGGVTREMFLLPSELRLYELRDKHGVKRDTNLYVIRNAQTVPEYAAVQPRVGSIAERSISTLIKSQATGDLMTLYYESKENKVSFNLTSIPHDLKDDSKTMFDRRYMTGLFDRGFSLGKAGKAWRAKVPDGQTASNQ